MLPLFNLFTYIIQDSPGRYPRRYPGVCPNMKHFSCRQSVSFQFFFPLLQNAQDKIYTELKLVRIEQSVLTLKTKNCQTWKISPDPLEEVEVSMEMHSI